MSGGAGNLKPFVPGDPRINRRGRKAGKSIADHLAVQLKKVYTLNDGTKAKLMELICMQLTTLAAKGNLRAIEIIFERLEGRPMHFVDLPPDAPPSEETSAKVARVKDLLKRFDFAAMMADDEEGKTIDPGESSSGSNPAADELGHGRNATDPPA